MNKLLDNLTKSNSIKKYLTSGKKLKKIEFNPAQIWISGPKKFVRLMNKLLDNLTSFSYFID